MPPRRSTQALLPSSRRHRSAEGGFSLVEVIVALGLLVTVMVTTAGYFVTSLKQSNGQTQAQEATVLADAMLDYTRSVAGASLLSGRTQAAVHTSLASPPPGVDLSQDITTSGNYDAAATGSRSQAVPLTMVNTIAGTKYTTTTFIDQCYVTSQTATDCKSAVTSLGWMYRITVDVTYALAGGRSCANNTSCYFVATTLRDPGSNPCFNVNLAFAGCSTSQPTITNISPNTATTNSVTTVTVTGTNFDLGATVSLDTGGSVSSITINSSTNLTFTLAADNTPAAVGTRTVKVTNPNGKFAYGTVTITSSAIHVYSVTPSPIYAGSTNTLTVSGSGFETNGSVVSIPAAAGTIVGTPAVTANAITLTFAAGTSGSSAGIWPLTVTNPDGNSAAANVTIQYAPVAIASVSPSSMSWASTRSFTITGSGFNRSAQVTLDGAATVESWVSASQMKIALGYDPAVGTHTFTVTNPDGGSDTVTFTVTGAHITSITPGSSTHGRSVTVTITGTDFVATGTTTPEVSVDGSTSAVSKVKIVSTTKVTFTFAMPSVKGSYTYQVQVTSKDGSISDVYQWTVSAT